MTVPPSRRARGEENGYIFSSVIGYCFGIRGCNAVGNLSVRLKMPYAEFATAPHECDRASGHRNFGRADGARRWLHASAHAESPHNKRERREIRAAKSWTAPRHRIPAPDEVTNSSSFGDAQKPKERITNCAAMRVGQNARADFNFNFKAVQNSILEKRCKFWGPENGPDALGVVQYIRVSGSICGPRGGPSFGRCFSTGGNFCCSPTAQRADDPNAVREQFVEGKATCNVNDKISPTTGDGLENPKPGPLGGTAFKTTFQDSRDFGARKNFKFEMLNLPRPPA